MGEDRYGREAEKLSVSWKKGTVSAVPFLTSGRVQEEYITDLEHLNDGRDADGKLATEGSFLEINAVDGTVYNAEVGY